MSHYHHLTLRDRVFISALTISGKSLSEIACAIGKNVSTISRELKRNKRVCNFLWAARSRLIDVGGDSVTK